MSDYHQWKQKAHASEWMLFAKNLGEHLSIDETAISNGKLYTVLTSKSAKGRRGAIVVMIKGTESEKVIKILKQIPAHWREKVREVTLDMAGSMNKIVRKCFPKAVKVIDRFHVQKLAFDALQEMRISHRWQAIDDENDAISEAKLGGAKYVAHRFENGDTAKQLLARSRYLLFKSPYKWSTCQRLRAGILFREYPDLSEAFDLTQKLRVIYSKTKDKAVAYTKLARWYEEVERSGFRSFNTIAASIYTHYEGILNYFDNRSTNASAESFNAKLKAFRSIQRGVRDLNFFMFRLAKIYA